MDTDSLVESFIVGGQRLVEELPQRGFEMLAAFWIKPNWDGKWYFYIVSPWVDTEGSLNAYGRLLPLVRAMPQPYLIDPLKIKLIGPSDPLAQDVLAALSRIPSPGVSPVRWRGIWLGNLSIDGVHLYPVPAATA